MVANSRIALVLAARARSDVRLLFFRRESHELRDRVTITGRGRVQTLPINPDGFWGLQFPTLPEGRNRAFFFLEADRSTMTRERFLEKLRGYAGWFEQGGHTRKLGIRSFRVLTVTKSEPRMGGLLTAARETEDLRPALRLFWFASETRFTAPSTSYIFDPVWETPDRPGSQQSLLPPVSPAS
jgi:hypothetical protein